MYEPPGTASDPRCDRHRRGTGRTCRRLLLKWAPWSSWAVLSVLLRKRRLVFYVTLLATSCVAAGLGGFCGRFSGECADGPVEQCSAADELDPICVSSGSSGMQISRSWT